VRDDVDNELPGATLGGGLGVSEGVLLAPVVVQGGAEQQGHRVAADAGEEGEGGQVGLAGGGDRRDKGDGAREDGTDEEFVTVGLGKGQWVKVHAGLLAGDYSEDGGTEKKMRSGAGEDLLKRCRTSFTPEAQRAQR